LGKEAKDLYGRAKSRLFIKNASLLVTPVPENSLYRWGKGDEKDENDNEKVYKCQKSIPKFDPCVITLGWVRHGRDSTMKTVWPGRATKTRTGQSHRAAGNHKYDLGYEQ
jgi:hypothetical protein